MQLERLVLTNFRGFGSLTITFDPDLTVLIGRNGAGKSSVVRALVVLLSRWTAQFGGDAEGFERDDVRWAAVDGHRLEPQFPAQIALTAWIADAARTWDVSNQTLGATSSADDALIEAASALRAKVTQPEPGESFPRFDGQANAVDMPLIAAFAARVGARPEASGDDGRWLNSRTLAYRGALTGDLYLDDLSTWLATREKALNQRLSEQLTEADLETLGAELLAGLQAGRRLSSEQLLRQRAGMERAPETEAVATAALACLDDASALRYDIAAAELRIVWADGRELPFRLLSDGQKRIMTLAARLAWLAYRLNPHHGPDAAASTSGVVLIDELELHLHPEWQQTVIGRLRKAFPRLQFIVTTHSPQVLSTVDARQIRRLSLIDGEGIVEPVEQQTRGVASNDVLATAMHVDPVPDVPEWRDLLRYRAMIEDGEAASEQARSLRASLDAHFGERHPLMADCDRLIRFVAFTKRRGTGS